MIAEIVERLSNLSITCSKPAVLGDLSELALDLWTCLNSATAAEREAKVVNR
jgi:hypothetical protein